MKRPKQQANRLCPTVDRGSGRSEGNDISLAAAALSPRAWLQLRASGPAPRRSRAPTVKPDLRTRSRRLPYFRSSQGGREPIVAQQKRAAAMPPRPRFSPRKNRAWLRVPEPFQSALRGWMDRETSLHEIRFRLPLRIPGRAVRGRARYGTSRELLDRFWRGAARQLPGSQEPAGGTSSRHSSASNAHQGFSRHWNWYPKLSPPASRRRHPASRERRHHSDAKQLLPADVSP